MSFQVPGTLVVEPTESEDLAELDRFVEAMVAIRAEIDKVGAGEWPAGDNRRANAPDTAAVVRGDAWDHPCPRAVGACPTGTAAGSSCGAGRRTGRASGAR